LDCETEFLYKAVYVIAFAVSSVFTIYFLSQKRYTGFLFFAFLSVAFAALALDIFELGND
jgi:hypothetical protein